MKREASIILTKTWREKATAKPTQSTPVKNCTLANNLLWLQHATPDLLKNNKNNTNKNKLIKNKNNHTSTKPFFTFYRM